MTDNVVVTSMVGEVKRDCVEPFDDIHCLQNYHVVSVWTVNINSYVSKYEIRNLPAALHFLPTFHYLKRSLKIT